MRDMMCENIKKSKKKTLLTNCVTKYKVVFNKNQANIYIYIYIYRERIIFVTRKHVVYDFIEENK